MSCASCGKSEDWCRCNKWCELCGGDTNHTTRQHMAASPVLCKECNDVAVKDEDEMCSECVSEQAEYYTPDKGGEG